MSNARAFRSPVLLNRNKSLASLLMAVLLLSSDGVGR